ncbi:MAG: NAD(P)-dependent oxidoreductase [Anaerolineae bacterium]|nr:MAG: NAD(P)-dependent oxidoreductase [Anaerolineae bacterium]
MTILITGAFGNIGSSTVAEALRQGYTVRCLDVRTKRTEQAARRVAGGAEILWGDIRDPQTVQQAVQGVDAVIHLAAILPPQSDEQPDLAWEVNFEGTRTLVDACRAQEKPPRFLLASTFDLFGHTQDKQPPRKVSDPIEITDIYTKAKAACEDMLRVSGLPWLIFRFADVPIIGLRPAHPIMYEIGLHNRIEALHPADAALAVVNALGIDSLWGAGKTLLIGGGKSCQVTYREYLEKILNAMGVGMLPEAAFSQKEYVTDWLDSTESQALLRYQRHSFDDIVGEIAAQLGWRKIFMPLARPFARRAMLRLSPYWKQT